MIKISEFQQMWKNLRENQLFLACSGGVDSMVLLHLLHEITSNLTVLHVNYQLRGKDSDEDEALVKSTCEALNIPCQIRRMDTKSVLQNGGNLQDLTRKFRYQWFKEILQQDNQNLILLGHQCDDQVETFFQHIARKSGITGMAGMLEKHAGIVRPLLRYRKNEIYDFARANNIVWREDVSNESSIYTRNKLRNIILPELENEISDLRESVLVLVKAFQETHSELRVKTQNQSEKIRQIGIWELSDYDDSTSEEKAEILRNLGIRQTFMAEIEKIRSSQKGKKLSADGFEITREINSIHFGKQQITSTFELKFETVSTLPQTFDKNTIYLDGSKITGKLHLRNWQIGDRMKPIGMQGSKAISDILKDAKIASHEKANVQLLVDDEKILWCVGIKISAVAVAGLGSDEILKVSVDQLG